MAATDQFGGIAIDEPAKDEFGGVAVGDGNTDEFGGVPVNEENTQPEIKLNPYDVAKARMGELGIAAPEVGSSDFTQAMMAGADKASRKLGSALHTVGTGIGDIAKAYAFEAIAEPQLQAQQLGIDVPGEETPDIPPWTQGKLSLPAPLRALSTGAEGLIESTPQMAAAAVDPLLGAVAFGSTPQGFDSKQAVIAYAAPFLGKHAGAITEAIAKKSGVSSDAALFTFNKLGGATGVAGLIGADQAREISNLPKEQQREAWIDAAGNIGSMVLLGTLGERKTPTTERKVSNARNIEEATAVHGNLLASAGEGAKEVPTSESGGGIQSQTTGGLPETKTREIPLIDAAGQLEQLKALENPTPEQIIERDTLQKKSDAVKGSELMRKQLEELRAKQAEIDKAKDPVTILEQKLDDPKSKKTNQETSQPAGLALTSVEQLNRLKEIQQTAKKQADEVMAEAKKKYEAGDKAVGDALMQKRINLLPKIQLTRETVETAANVGSHAESPNTNYGPRPLDWKNKPEIAQWLKQNGEKLGIALPDELKTSVQKPSEPIQPGRLPEKPVAPALEGGPQKVAEKQVESSVELMSPDEAQLFYSKQGLHAENIGNDLTKAIENKKPINSQLADWYGYKNDLPNGYIREGNQYVFKPSAPKQTPADVGKPYATGMEPGFVKMPDGSVVKARDAKGNYTTEFLNASSKAFREKTATVGAMQKPQPIGPGAKTVDEPENQGAIATSTPLTPSTTTTQLTPKSQRQIITDLAKGLNLPIRFGRLTTSKFAGYFKPRSNLIGSKKAVDVPTVSHEVGHKLDDTLKLSTDKTIASELGVLGDPATPGSGSSWTPSKTNKYKMGEGVAEFVRYWLTDPAKALKEAPNTHAVFESALNANKDFGDVMRQAQEDIKTWRESEPQARLRSHISTDNPNKTRYTLSQLTRDLVDDLHILRLATEEAKKSTDLPPSKDPYLAARNLRGSYGMAESFIRDGVADFNTKEVKLGTSLEDALAPVAGRLSDFRDWIVAKRAKELRAQGKETGLVASDVDAVADKFDKDPVFQKAFDDVKAWNDAALQYAVDSGLITPESAAAMRKMNQDYVPFSRLFEVGAGESPSQQGMGIGSGLNVGKPGSFKRLSGSTREIVDPIETMIKNAYTIITASEKAAINRSVAEMASLPNMGKWVERVAAPKEGIKFDMERVRKQLEDAGADLTNVPDDLILSFFRQSGRAPFGENIIRVIRNGEPEFYRLNKDLHDTFQALDLEDSGKLVRMLSAPAQLLRAGVVLEPSFNVANALRDTFSAAVISKYGALPFETTLKGIAAMIKNPQAIAEWAAAGGKNSVEANYFDRTKMQNFLREKISKDLTPAERALIVVKSPLTALRWLTSVAEEATRIGEYQIAYKKLTESGMPEGEARRLAAFEARDRQDFAKGGAKTKIIRHMSAFWNAGLQANVKLAQAFRQRPARTLLTGLAFITIPKLLEQAINWDDKDYWNRQQWERDLFFMIPIGKDETGHTRFLRIPTPFEPGIIFGTFPGRLMQWLKTNKPDSVKDFPTMMLKQSVPNPIPQSLNVIYEDFLSGEKGWDIWRGRTIVPESLADLPADLQWTEQTSGLAKQVGKMINFSPMKIDHIIESTTGGIGKLATGRQVPGQRFVAAPLRVSNEPLNQFYNVLDELRKQNAKVKLENTGTRPRQLSEFEKTSRELAELRDKARKSSSDAQKAIIQEQIFLKAKQQMDKHEAASR